MVAYARSRSYSCFGIVHDSNPGGGGGNVKCLPRLRANGREHGRCISHGYLGHSSLDLPRPVSSKRPQVLCMALE